MPQLLALCLLIAWAPLASAQEAGGAAPDTSRAVIDSVYAAIHAEWLYRNEVDWDSLDAAFQAEVDAAATFDEALGAFRGVFGAAGDVHSAIYYAGRGIAYRPLATEPPTRAVSALIMLSREQANRPEGRPLADGTAYIRVPAYGVQGDSAISAAASELRELVCDLVPGTYGGWILDLRVNEGGNIHPMLSGLGDLLGDGPVFRTVLASGETQFAWSISGGVLSIDGYSAATVERRCPEAARGRIAVLIGPATLSSGQITAVAFAGWDRARLFGDPTAEGYATSNRYMPITPALALNLSTAYFEDRSGHVHPGTVLPDEAVPGAWVLDAPEADPVVQRALAWLGGE
ncbi:MAG: S41 family peptidase [Bacteroidota bacterium]